MRGGKRPGAGRPKGAKEGSPTKRAIRREMTERIVENALSEGVMPLEVMLAAMREEWNKGNKQLAAEFAKDAAPYCHAKLASIEHSGEMTQNVVTDQPAPTPDEWTRAHADAGAPTTH